MGTQATQMYKRSVSGSIGAGMGSIFNASGRKYFILEHKTGSEYHKAGETQEIIVDEIEIGRDAKCAVRFDDSFKTVSRRHAAIVRDGDGWKLVQLSQTNSTLLNGQPIKQEWYLQSGDEIQLSVNGPKLGFIIPTGNKSTVGSIGLSRRLSLFRQQALRPFKTALWILGCLLLVAIGAGVGYGVYVNNLLKVQLSDKEITEQELNRLKQELKERNEKDTELINTIKGANFKIDSLQKSLDNIGENVVAIPVFANSQQSANDKVKTNNNNEQNYEGTPLVDDNETEEIDESINGEVVSTKSDKDLAEATQSEAEMQTESEVKSDSEAESNSEAKTATEAIEQTQSPEKTRKAANEIVVETLKVEDNIEQIKSNVYLVIIRKIECIYEGEIITKENIGFGTGYLLNDGRFITARHVVEPWAYLKNEEDPMLFFNIRANNGGKVVCYLDAYSPTGKIISFTSEQAVINRNSDNLDMFNKNVFSVADDSQDWAYYQTEMKDGLSFNNNLSETLPERAKLTVYGYPLGYGAKSTRQLSPIYSEAIVASNGIQNGYILTTAATFEHGNSGGPVFANSKSGDLIIVGLVSGGAGRSTGLVIPISSVK